MKGSSYNYDYDGKDVKKPHLAWYGRAFISPTTAKAQGPLPLVVFIHGLNAAQIKYRWMGGGNEGDVRRIVGDLIEHGKMQPAIVAGPSSIIKSQVKRGSSFRNLDLDRFLDITIAQLDGIAQVDERRIIVAGDSGAGCSLGGGLLGAVRSKRTALAILSLDTCLIPGNAKLLGEAKPETHVISNYQKVSWGSRDFRSFVRAFEKHVKPSSVDGVFRAIEQLKPKRSPHDQVVPMALNNWLPKLLPPK